MTVKTQNALHLYSYYPDEVQLHSLNEKKNAYADVGLNEKPCIFEKMSFQVRGSDNVRLFRKRK